MTTLTPPFGLTVCGIEELASHCETGASHVLSILDPDRPVPEAFGSFGEHAKLEMRFHDIVNPADGQIAPGPEHVEALLGFGDALRAGPAGIAHLLVHCHAGISRSTASMVLILAQAMPEQPAAAILGLVHEIREKAWPNILMIEMGDAALGRQGTLIAATHALHRLQLGRRPHLADYMRGLDRAREVEVALRSEPLRASPDSTDAR